MPRWLTTLLVLLIIFAFVVPDPVGAGNSTGNAIDSMVVFFRSAGNELAGTATASEGSVDGYGSARYPRGGIGSGDGTYRMAPVALGAVPATRIDPQAPAAVPAPVDTAADTGAEGTLSHSRPVQLHIPTIGVSTGLVGLGLEPDGTMEVPEVAQAVGWYRDAPSPGERGPAVVTAHVDWREEKGAFHDLRRMRPGDEVTVDRADGVAAVFRVARVEQYPKSRFPTEEVYGGTDGAELRLITCGGRFDHATHNYTDNIVVYATMTGVN